MEYDVRILQDKKIGIMKSFQAKADAEQQQLLTRAIELTQQGSVQHARICRVAKIYPNQKDQQRVRAGGLTSTGVDFPENASHQVLTAEESYQIVKNNYRALPATTKNRRSEVKVAAVQPQAINLASLLSVEILGSNKIQDFKKLINTLNAINKVCNGYSKVSGDKVVGAVGKTAGYAKKAVELYAPIKFYNELPHYLAALDVWVSVGNSMIDYVDPHGTWSFYDFH